MFQPLTGSLKRKLATSTKNVVKRVEKEDISHVTAWAVNFDLLLHDKSGISLFEDFLRLEYSEENVEFWRECEDYRNISDSCTRRLKARAIYDKYISPESPDTVNIDDYVRIRVNYLLDSPTSDVFTEAQKQVYNLMKQDSYPRFLKSDIFKNSLMNKMERKLPDPNVSMNTSGGVMEALKGGSLHRHFRYWNTTETNNKEKEENNQNSWIRKRVDSINSILRWKNRSRH